MATPTLLNQGTAGYRSEKEIYDILSEVDTKINVFTYYEDVDWLKNFCELPVNGIGLDFVNALSPKSYIFNDKTRTHYGLIAQDVETVLSEIGKSTQEFAGFIKTPLEEIDGTKTDDVRYGLRMAEFITPMIKAIQELSAKVTALENA